MTDLDFKAIGQKIRERRQAVGVTQEYIANRLDVNPSHVSNIECGHANPSLTALVRIADILECSVDYFIASEYTFSQKEPEEQTLDDKIMDRVSRLDHDTKSTLLRVLDVL